MKELNTGPMLAPVVGSTAWIMRERGYGLKVHVEQLTVPLFGFSFRDVAVVRKPQDEMSKSIRGDPRE